MYHLYFYPLLFVSVYLTEPVLFSILHSSRPLSAELWMAYLLFVPSYFKKQFTGAYVI